MILAPDGNLYMMGAYYGQFRKAVIATGQVTSYYNYISCCVGVPTGIALSASGSFFFVDSYNYRILTLPYTSLAVNAPNTAFVGMTGSGDGDSWVAGFTLPNGLAVSPDSSTLYVADTNNNRVRAVDTTYRFVTTVAGGGSAPINGVGPGIADGGPSDALFYGPYGLTAISNTTLLLTDATTHQVRLVDACNGTVTLAGTRPASGVPPSWNSQGWADSAVGTSAKFSSPFFSAVLPSGSYIIADAGNHRLRAVTPLGVVSTLAGSGIAGLTNASAATAQLNAPHGVAVNASGFVIFSETGNHAVRCVTPSGNVAPLAGPWQGAVAAGAVDGVGTDARFNQPKGLAVFLHTGGVYVADWNNKKIRVITPSGNTILVTGGASGAHQLIVRVSLLLRWC